MKGKEGGKRISIDLGDITVHVSQFLGRVSYNLEKLWSDTLIVDLSAWVD